MRIRNIAGALAVLCLTAGAQAGSLFNANLINNPGAELSFGGSGYSIDPPSEWVASGNFTVVSYATVAGGGDFPASFPGSGDNFFAGGPSNASSSATQVLDVSGGASLIDLGGVSFYLSGYLGGWSYRNDNATLIASFQDASGNVLGNAVIGPIWAEDRSEQTGFVFCASSGPVPTGTRGIEFVLQMTCTGGTYNHAYADNLSFVMTGQEVPPTNAVPLPAGVWMGMSLLGGVGGMGALRRRLGRHL